MVVFLLLAGLIFGGGHQAQEKYDYCKGIKFEGDYCKNMKSIDELGK